MVVHVLITGANSGVGFATAKVLASVPNHHVILAARNQQKGEKATDELRKASHSAVSVSNLVLDVNERSSIESAAKTVTDQFGKLDVLINNAGIFNPKEGLEKQLTDTFRTNVLGPALTTHHFLPLLLKASKPYVLHIGSSLGSLTLTADPDRFDSNLRCIGYRTSKAALQMLAIEGAKELGPQGVKVFVVCPGLVESNLRGTDDDSRTAGGKAGSPEISANLMRDIIQGKRDGDVGKFVHKDGIHPW